MDQANTDTTDSCHPSRPQAMVPVEDLQLMASRASAEGFARCASVSALVFGGLTVASALLALKTEPLNCVSVGAGTCLVVLGLWYKMWPSPASLLTVGLCLVAIGGWGVFLFFHGLPFADSSDPGVKRLVLGIVEIVWGLTHLGQYWRHIRTAHLQASDKAKVWFDDMVRYIHETDPEQASDVIPLQITTVSNRRQWRAWLGDDMAMLVEDMDREVLFARKNDVEVRRRGKYLLRNKYQAEVRVNKRCLDAAMTPDALARFEAWKTSTTTNHR